MLISAVGNVILGLQLFTETWRIKIVWVEPSFNIVKAVCLHDRVCVCVCTLKNTIMVAINESSNIQCFSREIGAIVVVAYGDAVLRGPSTTVVATSYER